MKRTFIHLFQSVSLFFLVMMTINGYSQNHELLAKISGSWSGTLKVGTVGLTMVINISTNEKDSLVVTIDSPDQGALGFATSKVLLSPDSILIKSKVLAGSYRGAFGEDHSVLNGEWKQAGMAFPLILHHSNEKYALKRPQEPKPPYPYLEREVTIRNEKAATELSGTLTLPKEGGPFPVVILITGSGPQNRNEELLGHKPFLVLADYLARKGIAVLRCDDRGFGKSTGSFSTATTLDFVTDVSAEVDFIKSQKEIDTTEIGLLGHSEGGLIAPIVASQRKDIAYLVLLAGPGVTGEKILLQQTAILNKKAGFSDQEIEADRQLRTKIYTAINKNPDNEKAEQQIRKLFAAAKKKQKTGNGLARLEDDQIRGFIKESTSPWFRTFLVLDPLDYLSKVHCSLLALNGSLDVQVPSKENLAAIEKALIFGGNSRYTVEEIPGANHLFQEAKTGNIDEYKEIEETMSPAVLEKIAGWINKVRNQ